eukprot:20525-Heterococcus_DN1.PRE.2
MQQQLSIKPIGVCRHRKQWYYYKRYCLDCKYLQYTTTDLRTCWLEQWAIWHSSDVHGNNVQHSSANTCVIVAAAVAAALSAVKNLTHAQHCVHRAYIEHWWYWLYCGRITSHIIIVVMSARAINSSISSSTRTIDTVTTLQAAQAHEH